MSYFGNALVHANIASKTCTAIAVGSFAGCNKSLIDWNLEGELACRFRKRRWTNYWLGTEAMFGGAMVNAHSIVKVVTRKAI